MLTLPIFLGLLTLFVVLLAQAAIRYDSQRGRRVTVSEGRRLLEAGEPAQARQVLERIARQASRAAPGREPALYWLARALELEGRPHAARRVYLRYLADYELPRSGPRAAPEAVAEVHRRLGALLQAQSAPLAEGEPGLGEGAAPANHWERFKGELQRLGGVSPDGAREAPARPVRVDEEALRRDGEYLARGLRVGDYVLAEKLGDGGFGEVFRAVRPVAIKFARDPEALEQLRRFGAIQGRVRSSRVVQPLEVALDADPPYVVMEFVDGPTLQDLLRARGALEPGLALPLLTEVARGLRDAHQGGVFHLDLKPANVLLDASGAVKITDFELGRLEGEAAQLALSLSFQSGQEVAGTLAYMSPEQRAGKAPDARSDVFTFGVILFEALTGTLPEPGDRPSDFVKELPPEVDAVFERCFARHERRYADAEALVRDLERLLQRLPAGDLREALKSVPARRETEAIPRALSARVAERALVAEEDPGREGGDREAEAEASESPGREGGGAQADTTPEAGEREEEGAPEAEAAPEGPGREGGAPAADTQPEAAAPEGGAPETEATPERPGEGGGPEPETEAVDREGGAPEAEAEPHPADAPLTRRPSLDDVIAERAARAAAEERAWRPPTRERTEPEGA